MNRSIICSRPDAKGLVSHYISAYLHVSAKWPQVKIEGSRAKSLCGKARWVH